MLNSKLFWDLNIRHKTIESIQKKIGASDIYDSTISWFSHLKPKKLKQTKQTIIKKDTHKWDQITHKSFCTKVINKKTAEWKVLFANGMTSKGLITKIYQQLIQLCTKKKKKIQWKKWVEDSNQHFFQRRHIDGKQARAKRLHTGY